MSTYTLDRRTQNHLLIAGTAGPCTQYGTSQRAREGAGQVSENVSFFLSALLK